MSEETVTEPHVETAASAPAEPPGARAHWLVRPGTIKLLWVFGLALLALVTWLGLNAHPHAKFGIEGTPAFFSWYGFIACVAMVVFAKFILGPLLSRRDGYYDD
ncbi:MAG: hypothetical protein HQL35_08145 [Alphaproteobacteria bacterium]|nr:hypothetical protein [Alphaproteobacteria bacterium]